MPGVHATNDYACILIWDAHMRMGHNIGPYAHGISHTRMGRPIRVWDNIRIWGRISITDLNHILALDIVSSRGLLLDTAIFAICLHVIVNSCIN